MKNKKLIVGIVIVVAIVIVAIAFATMGGDDSDAETVKFGGKKYTLLEYNMDIYFYSCNREIPDYEEDSVVPIEDSKYATVFVNEDLFCDSKEISSAIEYYGNDDNYEWYLVVETDDSEKSQKVKINPDDMEYLYSMEELEREKTLFVDEIEAFGRIDKISKDGTVRGQLNLALYEGAWYWRSEIIDENQEVDGTWPEYVQPLPQELSDTLCALNEKEK